jgi:hypothetical protein
VLTEKKEFLMSEPTAEHTAAAPTLDTYPVKVDLKALQKAMVITRLAYHNRGILAGTAAMPSVPLRKPKPAPAAPLSPTHHQDAFGDTDEKHLPWAFD